jgi:hypothetical protein
LPVLVSTQVASLEGDVTDAEAERVTMAAKLFSAVSELNEAKRRLVGPLLLEAHGFPSSLTLRLTNKFVSKVPSRRLFTPY